MSNSPPSHQRSSAPQIEVQRPAAASRSGLDRLKSLFDHRLVLERRGLQLHVVMVDRRPPSPQDPAVALALLRDELRDRLQAHQDAHTAQVMRHLVFVYDELGRRGWNGVGMIPAHVLRKALMQAEMLASEESSPRWTQLVDRLRAFLVAAELREDRVARPRSGGLDEHMEVSEVSHEEFAEMQRGWVATVSSCRTLQPLEG